MTGTNLGKETTKRFFKKADIYSSVSLDVFAMMTIEAAKAIIRTANPDASDLVLNDLLTTSKTSLNRYRPYIVAAYSLVINPPRGDLIRADGEATWQDWMRRVERLINIQGTFDKGLLEGETIPVGWSVEEVKDQYCKTCESERVSDLSVISVTSSNFWNVRNSRI